MKSSTSCRICRRWLEGEWADMKDPEGRAALQRQMDQGHCDGCPPRTGPYIWPGRTKPEDGMEPTVHRSGNTRSTFTIAPGAPSLIGYEDLAVSIWTSRRQAAIDGLAVARWWVSGDTVNVTVDGRITPAGVTPAQPTTAFTLAALLTAGATGNLARWSVELPVVRCQRRRGGMAFKPVQVTVSLVALERPDVVEEDELRISIVPGSLRIGRLPL